MSSSSDYSNASDQEEMEEYEMVMQINEDEEDEVQKHRRYVCRDREIAEQRLMEDYFSPSPKYTAETFRKRYRMTRELFLEIVEGWHGQFGRGDKRHPTIILEAVASYDLWIWHAFFGVAGANNDITVLHHSPLFEDLLADNEPLAPYLVNGQQFERGYYLTDGIYPLWSCFVKSFSQARDDKIALFKRRQESARKDIERAFGVLQGRWRIIAQPARAWSVNKLRRIMYTCIILHNMILKHQGFSISEAAEMYIAPGNHFLRSWVERCAIRRRKQRELRDRDVHSSLQRNLIEHVWRQEQP